MAVVPMKRLELFALRRDRKAILELLQRRGVVEVESTQASGEVFRQADTSQAQQELETQARLLEQAVELLDHTVPVKKGMLSFLAGRKPVTWEEYQRQGQEAPALLEQAREILRLGKESGLAVLERYGQWTVATADIQTAARACKAGKNREFLELALAPCDSLDVAALAQAAGQGMEPLLEYLESTPYSQGAQALRESFSAFEKWRDDQAMELVKGEKAEYESAGPLFAYAVARRREADTVRVILSGKRNGLEDGLIRERLRETYV